MAPPRPPTEVEGRRTASAGHAIFVVVVALVVAALVNSNSLVQSIQGEAYGTSRTVGLALAKPIRTLSQWTGLDLPRRILDDLTQHNAPSASPPPLPSPVTLPAPTTTLAPTPGTTTSSTLPPRRVPTADQPLRIWLAGDSLMGSISQSFIEKVSGNPLLSPNADFRIGTGLTRPDVYDWPGAVSHEMATVNPDVVILIFGANDDQDMVSNGQRFVLQSPAWQQEYARRVNQIMGETANGVRQVIWLGIPAMRRPRLNQTKDYINQIVKSAAATHPNVTYVDVGPLVDGPNNGFATYKTSSGGQSVPVRDTDGIHLTPQGAGFLTPVLLADVDTFWRLPH